LEERRLVELLADKIYNKIIQICEEQNWNLTHEKHIDRVIRALTKAQLRFHNKEVKSDNYVVESLINSIYALIIANDEEQHRIMASPDFTNQICWALTTVQLRFYDDLNKLPKKNQNIIF
jgi:DNA-binding LacI/PurR family transcriptional regulator